MKVSAMKFPIRFERLYRTEHGVTSTYLCRLSIGRLNLHLFFRGDGEEDPHDHPWSFWTFPLHDYIEEVYDQLTGERRLRRVPRLRWSFRPAELAHRVIGRWHDEGYLSYVGLNEKWVTLVWKSKKSREWGFWTKDGWMAWREYMNVCRN